MGCGTILSVIFGLLAALMFLWNIGLYGAIDREENSNFERDLLGLVLAEINPTVKAMSTGELRLYIQAVPHYAAEDVEDAVEKLVDSLTVWELEGATIQRTWVEDEADIYVTWVRDYGDHFVGLAINQAVVHVGLGSTNCSGEWQAFDADTVKKALWHELGHTFGYGHSDDPNNIMYHALEVRFAVDEEFDEVIPGEWYWHIPICAKGTYRLDFETDDSRGEFEYAVLPLGIDAEDYFADPSLRHSNCPFGTASSFGHICEIDDGATVLIFNPDTAEALQVTGQIVLMDEPESLDMAWDRDAYMFDEVILNYFRELFAE